MASLDSKLVGVLGDRTTKVLKDVFGYSTIGDLLHHYPRRYLVRGELSDISELHEGDEVTILAEIFSVCIFLGLLRFPFFYFFISSEFNLIFIIFF